jgi:hypothetical protein
MKTSAEERSKSSKTFKISIIAGAINIFGVASIVIFWCFDVYLDLLSFVWLFAAPILAFAGFIAGVIAAFRDRRFLGLMLNLLPFLLGVVVVYYLLTPSDGIPPEYR